MQGTRLGPYRILEPLGAGGMGEVYLAEDTDLMRRVAVKILPEAIAGDADLLDRFQHEARTLASLKHPGIVMIHAVGEDRGVHFLAMEWIEGKTLDCLIPQSGLDLARFLGLAQSLAAAIAAAHDKGITHRDLKPANVMVTDDGQLKVLDFGLAKVSADAGDQASALVTAGVTRVGQVLGTAAYMAPEQIEGKRVEPSADVFSLGIVLYEMATGSRPFQGRTAGAVMAAILKEEPTPITELRPDLPPLLGQIIERCLSKRVDARYATAGAVGVELEQLQLRAGSGLQTALVGTRSRRRSSLLLGAAATAGLLAVLTLATAWWPRGDAPDPGESSVVTVKAGQPSVAVLPFRQLDVDDSARYLRLAIPDEITTLLSRNPNLAVRPFALSSHYEVGEVAPDLVGRELRAASVITGHFYKAGADLQLTLELIDTDGNRVLWRSSVAAPADDLIALRSLVAEQVTTQLLPLLGVAVSAAGAGTHPQSGEGYDLYLRAKAIARDPEPNREAIELLDRAVQLDPGFAPAWADLGMRLRFEATFGDREQESIPMRAAEEAVATALRLDPELITPVTTRILSLAERGEVANAIRLATGLVERQPESAAGHFALSYAMRYAGRLQEAMAECELALARDPTNPRWRSCGWTFQFAGEYERAEIFFALDGDSIWAADARAHSLLAQGRVEEALDQFRRLPGDYRYSDESRLVRSCVRGDSGQDEAIREAEAAGLAEGDAELSYTFAPLLAFCGAGDAALRLVRHAIALGYCAYPAMENEPMFEPLRTSAEYARVRAAAIECRQRVRKEVSDG